MAKKKGLFEWQRNPFKIWQSYLGAYVFGLLAYETPIVKLFSLLSFRAPTLVWFFLYVTFLSIIISGFFIGASFKKGKDNFLQYGIFFLILAGVLYYSLIISVRF